MPRKGNPIRARFAAICALTWAASMPVHAQFFPDLTFDPGESSVGNTLRCWYRMPSATRPLATDHVVLPDQLAGHWATHAGTDKVSMFYTALKRADLKQRCQSAVAAQGYPSGLADVVVRRGLTRYNVPIWFEGDQAPGEPVERIVAFGDSLSDTGNMYNSSEWTFPVHTAWYLGRFSNGPVWTEYLARKLNVPLQNWAVGGAQTDKAFGLINGVDAQVKSFGAYAKHAAGYDPSRTLFTMLVGANDFMADERTDIKHVTDVLARQHDALVALAGMGARKILVLNLPDVSKTPSFRAAGREYSALLMHDKVRIYNDDLPRVVEKIRADTGADIRIFDVAGKFSELLADPGTFGMANTTEACLDMDADNKADYLRGKAMRATCNPARHVFWDRVHPTTHVHKLIADWAFTTARDAWGVRER